MSAADAAPPLDRRTHPWRDDLAADWLAGRVAAARFVAAEETVVATGVLSVREAPRDDARQSSELLFGERFHVYERARGWAWGQNQSDGYVGYVRETGVRPADGAEPPPDSEVAALRSYLFPEPDLKSVPRDTLHITTRVAVTDVADGWSRVAGPSGAAAGWIWTRHLVPIAAVETDPVAVARRFLGAPYTWGGRSSYGVDCSGLVQLALARCGRAVPRDSDQQAAAVGRAVPGGLAAAEPGDLLFMPGHVVFLSAPGRVLHANAHHMAVVEEPLEDFLARLRDLGLEITGARRP